MPQKKKNPFPTPTEAFILKLLSNFGLSGTFFALLMYYGSKEQYQEFIDTFILLKISNNSGISPIVVLVYVILGASGIIFFLHQRIRIKDERIRILENDLRVLQEQVQKNKQPKKSVKG